MRVKYNLEKSLRSETLTNEEQRTYIEILKQAIEQKLEDMGLQNLLVKYKGETVDIYSELIKLKSESDIYRQENGKLKNLLLDHEHQIKMLKEQLGKAQQERSQLLKAREKVQEDMEKGIQALALAKNQILKLQEEKQSRLDLKEYQFKKGKNLISETNQKNDFNSKIIQEREGNFTELSQIQIKQKEMEAQIVERDLIIIEVESAKSQLEQQIAQAQAQENDYLYQKEVSQLKEQIIQKQEELHEAKNDIQKKVKQMENLMNEQKQIKETYEQTILNQKYEIDSLNLKVKDKEMTINDKQLTIEQTRQNLEQKKENYESIIQQLEGQIEIHNYKNLELQNQQENLLENMYILQQTLQDTQNELEQLAQQKEIFQSQVIDLERKLSFTETQRDESLKQLQKMLEKSKDNEISNKKFKQNNEKLQNRNYQDNQELLNSKNQYDRNQFALQDILAQKKSRNQTEIKLSEQTNKSFQNTLKGQHKNYNMPEEEQITTEQDNIMQDKERQKVDWEPHSYNDLYLQLQQKEYILEKTQRELEKINQYYQQLIEELHQYQTKMRIYEEENERYKERQLQSYTNNEYLQKEKLKMQLELQSTIEEQVKLGLKVDSLSSELQELEQKVFQYEMQIKQYQIDINQSKQSFEKLQNENQVLQQENQLQKQKLQNFSLVERNKESEEYGINQTFSSLEKEISVCKQKTQAYIEELERNQVLSSKFKEQIRQIREFQEKNVEDKFKNIRTFLDSLINEIKAQSLQLSYQTNEMDKLHNQNKKLESQNKEISQQEFKSKEQVNLIQQQLNDVQKQQKRENQILSSENSKLKQQIALLQEQIQNLGIEKSKIQLELNQQLQKTEELNKELDKSNQNQNKIAKHKQVLDEVFALIKQSIPSYDLQSKFSKLLNIKQQLTNQEIEKKLQEDHLNQLELQAKRILNESQNQNQLNPIRRQIDLQREKVITIFQNMQDLIKENKIIEVEIQQLEMKMKQSQQGTKQSNFNLQEETLINTSQQLLPKSFSKDYDFQIYNEEQQSTEFQFKQYFSPNLYENQGKQNERKQQVIFNKQTKTRYAHINTIQKSHNSTSRFEKYHGDQKK